MNERIGNIPMRKIFTEPTKPEELYEFFTYGLSLNSLDWRSHWWPDNMINHIKRRLWCVRIVSHSTSISMDYQPGVKQSENSWYIYERKYLTNVHK